MNGFCFKQDQGLKGLDGQYTHTPNFSAMISSLPPPPPPFPTSPRLPPISGSKKGSKSNYALFLVARFSDVRGRSRPLRFPLPVYSRHFSRGLWLSLIVLFSETARKLACVQMSALPQEKSGEETSVNRRRRFPGMLGTASDWLQ